MTTYVNITSIPGYCTNAVAQCAACNANYDAETCTVPLTVDVCSDTSPLVNSTPCGTVGGVTGSGAVYVSGAELLQGLGIDKIPVDDCWSALWHQAVVYIALAVLLGSLTFRDWSRKHPLSDLYFLIFPDATPKKYA